MTRTVKLSIIALLMSWAIAAADEAMEKEIRETRLDIQALELIHQLDLEKDQARKLVDLWGQMERLRTEHQKEMLSLLREKKALLLKDEVDKEKLIELEGRMKTRQTGFETQNHILRVKSEEVLNERQRHIFREILEGPPRRRLRPWPHVERPHRMMEPPPEIRGREPRWPERPFGPEIKRRLWKEEIKAEEQRAALRRMIEILREKK